MKKITIIASCIGLFSFTSCKKDMTCECTYTHTSSTGTVTTTSDNYTIRDVKKSEAKSLCQKSKDVYVGSSGSTTTDVNDCKLK